MFGNFPIGGPDGSKFEPMFNKAEKAVPEQKIEINIGKTSEPEKTDVGWEAMGLSLHPSKTTTDAVKAYASFVEATKEFDPRASLNPAISRGLDEYLATLPKVDAKTRMNITQAVNSFDAWYGDMEEFQNLA